MSGFSTGNTSSYKTTESTRKPDLLALTINIGVIHPRLEFHLQQNAPFNIAGICQNTSYAHCRRFERKVMAEFHRQYEFAIRISCFRLTFIISKVAV